eukprot:TRINITY_DN4774_c0_g1_i1.p1 TRINITY_DN4774_c0_g1~~TRINITY_DN4774_c0_g1_i1.p1  ORF type:complete len:147 (+),score=36.27 TRINITY_DN4774_c0_g1_i1:63-503(+)
MCIRDSHCIKKAPKPLVKRKWLKLARRIGNLAISQDDSNLELILSKDRCNCDDNSDAVSLYSDQNDYGSSSSTNVDSSRRGDSSLMILQREDSKAEKTAVDDFWIAFDKLSIGAQEMMVDGGVTAPRSNDCYSCLLYTSPSPRDQA